MEEEIKKYIRLAITDTARKCHVKEYQVINIFKKCVGLEI